MKYLVFLARGMTRGEKKIFKHELFFDYFELTQEEEKLRDNAEFYCRMVFILSINAAIYLYVTSTMQNGFTLDEVYSVIPILQ